MYITLRRGEDVENGKYAKNIEPLLQEVEGLENLIDCSDLERNTWDILDVINVLDVNFDGLLITYSLSRV